jgi:hypothetical protein
MLSTTNTESGPLTLELLLDAAEKVKNYRPEPVCPPHITSWSRREAAKRGETDGCICFACGATIR